MFYKNKIMSIKVEIIADSINSQGNRLTTFILEYPRFIHAEIMTHRVFSKNAASSRAIPIEKMIQQVIDNPATPVWWGKNQSGMQAKEELSNSDTICLDFDGNICAEDARGMNQYQTPMGAAKFTWLEARDSAIEFVKKLNSIGLHKQICNRILEPWFNMRIILSGTEFENFFALRAHEDAQPELQCLAHMMLDAYNNSTPKLLQTGEWHIPFGDRMNERTLTDWFDLNHPVQPGSLTWKEEKINELKRKVAIARCARVSYFNYEGKDDYAADIKLCDRLFGNIPKHLSPTEHVAQAMGNSDWSGNFKGFKQYRKFFNDENLTDGRVVKK